jgi:hypothetical protein
MLQGKVHMAQFSVEIRHLVGSVLAEKQQRCRRTLVLPVFHAERRRSKGGPVVAICTIMLDQKHGPKTSQGKREPAAIAPSWVYAPSSE